VVPGQLCHGGWAIKGVTELREIACFGKWYRVTATYDGKTLRNYVGDELQGEGSVQLAPQRPGHSSMGVRINLKDHFKGAIYEARFTRRALPERDFLKMPQNQEDK